MIALFHLDLAGGQHGHRFEVSSDIEATRLYIEESSSLNPEAADAAVIIRVRLANWWHARDDELKSFEESHEPTDHCPYCYRLANGGAKVKKKKK